MSDLLIMAGIVFMAVIVLITISELISKKKKCKNYVKVFEDTYKDDNVVNTLTKMQSIYKPKSIEYLAIDKSVTYLNKSILKDYQTAFAIIEDVFSNKEVEDLHDRVISNEKKKLVLALEKKE
jgi:hypothetical protein